MNMFKKTGGFTLVELIVVVAILAILAGIAIPAYSGYIKKAQDAKVVTELDAVATAAQAANAADPDGVLDSIVVGADKSITFTGNNATDFAANFAMFFNGNSIKADLTGTSYANGATWTNTTGKWTAN